MRWLTSITDSVDMLLSSPSVVSNSLQSHGLQHSRLLSPSLSPGVCSNSCPLSQWCHPTISSFVAPFFSCFQSFPASGSFSVSQFFPSGGQSIGASASVLPMHIQAWFPLGLTGLILLSKRLARVFSSTTVQKYQLSLFYVPTLTYIHDYWKNHCFTYMDRCWQSDVSAF